MTKGEGRFRTAKFDDIICAQSLTPFSFLESPFPEQSPGKALFIQPRNQQQNELLTKLNFILSNKKSDKIKMTKLEALESMRMEDNKNEPDMDE